jgi:hypothetical protein
MSVLTTVPVTITADAEKIVAGMGLQEQFEQILDHIRQTMPGLKSIRIEYAYPEELGSEPGVEIFVFKENTGEQRDPTWDALSDWLLATFPAVIWSRFTIHVLR